MRFQQLRWKLTLTYTAVTVGALITVELILLVALGAGVVFLINSGYLPEQLIRSGYADYAPVLEFYLSQSSPDYEGMQEWLAGVGAASSVTLPLSFDATNEMFIVGSDGALLAIRPPDLLGFDRIGKPLSAEDIPGIKEPLNAALAGVENPEQLYALDNIDRRVILAFPIRNELNREVLGVLVAIGELPTVWSQIGDILPVLGGSFLLFTIVAGVAGTVYGFLAARGPVQRLYQLAEATLAWSDGDFSMQVEDSSGDELGVLAHRLNEMSRQLQGLMETRRELAVAEERNRLARDLHDSAKQQAFAAAAQVSAARKHLSSDPQAADKHVQEAERLILALRQELTNLIQQIRPVGLNGKGLSAALQDYCEEWSRQTEINVEVRIRKQKSLLLEIEQTIFRIVQEALSNIARHSNASQVDIELIYDQELVTCTIQDNGVGFNPESTRKGLGLHSMQERAIESGGRLEIASKPGEGTSIALDMPFNDALKSVVED
jgi:NarL family two-component system sensor histidine kinase LiaS